MEAKKEGWGGLHRGTKAGKVGPHQDVMDNPNRELVARLKARRANFTATEKDRKTCGRQQPGSMKKVY